MFVQLNARTTRSGSTVAPSVLTSAVKTLYPGALVFVLKAVNVHLAGGWRKMEVAWSTHNSVKFGTVRDILNPNRPGNE